VYPHKQTDHFKENFPPGGEHGGVPGKRKKEGEKKGAADK